jgi:dTDP-4-amino-4,6-dideoxygalactose transaminase
MPVHYGGQIGDVAGVAELARKHDLKIIEDAAHCCPAYYKADAGGQGTGEGDHTLAPEPANDSIPAFRRSPWKAVGAEAAISCFSFYANKTITTGEGGMACTNDPAYAERMRIMSLHGISKDAWKRFTAEGSWYYEIVAPGFKYNLTDIAAAIGIHQLRRADELHERRTRWAQYYSSQFADLEEIILPRAHPARVHSWHLYPIRLRLDRLKIDRAVFIEELKKQGIGASVHWLPLHMHPYYRETYGYQPEDLPVAARLYPQLVSLPLYPDLDEESASRVSAVLKHLLQASRVHGTNLCSRKAAG